MSNNYEPLNQALGAGDRRAAAKYAFRPEDGDAVRRCADQLIKLRASLADLRARRSDQSMLLATWNIRDFDSNKFKFGPRLPESLYYIAEIISCFDLIALQEVNRDLSALERVMQILGHGWDYIATDSGGNDERMVFVFNRDRVFFRRVAGEIVLPEGQLIVAPEKVRLPENVTADAAPRSPAGHQYQFARSPFLVAFQSGWFRFSLCTAHIYYGAEKGVALERRIAEIRRLVKFFADRQDSASKQEKDADGTVENYIVLGDFNVVSPEHGTMQALKSNGFVVPPEIDGAKVRRTGQSFYDQIAVRVKDPRFKVKDGGMVYYYDTVFTDADREIYAAHVPDKDLEDAKPDDKPADPSKRKQKMTPEKLYQKWRTWQMSDHIPLWIEISTDFSDDYLQRIVDGAPAPAD